MDQIENYYYDPKVGYSSLNKLFEYNINNKLNLTRKEIKDWYHKQPVNQIYKQYNYSKKSYDKITSPLGEPGVIQADLMDLKKFSKHNKGFKYLFNVIDIHSRYAWSFPIKNKKPISIYPHLEKVLEQIKGYFYKTFTSDKGSEFNGSVKTLLQKYNVIKYTNDPHSIGAKNITSVIERFNRTLLTKIKKYMMSNQILNYVDVLDELVYNYNHSIHSNIGTTPYEKFNDKTIEVVHIDLQAPVVDQSVYTDGFQIGDKVRALKKLKTFDKKGLVPQYTVKVHTITERKGKRIILENGKSYFPQYLIKVDGQDEEVTETLKQYNEKVKENKKAVKIEAENKREGINYSNIIEGKRQRKPVKRMDL